MNLAQSQADLGTENWSQTKGFLLPLKSLISWSIKQHDKFFDYIYTNESVKQKIGKFKISWQIEYLHDLLEIKTFFENQYSFFKYLIVNNGKALLSRGADKDLYKNLNLDEFSFSSINLK